MTNWHTKILSKAKVSKVLIYSVLIFMYTLDSSLFSPCINLLKKGGSLKRGLRPPYELCSVLVSICTLDSCSILFNILDLFPSFCEEHFLISEIIKFSRLKFSLWIVFECIDRAIFCHKNKLYVFVLLCDHCIVLR